MKIRAVKTELKEILPFRRLFLQESNFQIRYNACHERNWSDSYFLQFDGVNIGYASIKGKEDLRDRDAVFEFYILPAYRKLSDLAFVSLLEKSKAPFIECQSNDWLLTSKLYVFAQNINADYILFQDDRVTSQAMPEVIFRTRGEEDYVFGLQPGEAGEYVLEKEGEIVATGGILLHYNLPFADLFMEVKKECQRMGYGSYIIQELKKTCYLTGRVPAARCQIKNKASKATLIKAGMKVCGFMLTGNVLML